LAKIAENCEHNIDTRVARWYTYFLTKNHDLGKFLEGLVIVIVTCIIVIVIVIDDVVILHTCPYGLYILQVFGIIVSTWYI
jgi:hypothetical protein